MSEEQNIEESSKAQGTSDKTGKIENIVSKDESSPATDNNQQSQESIVGSSGSTDNSESQMEQDSSPQQQPFTELQTRNYKPQTSTMEVHHHGHVHEKKKWLEYLFQFLMLFLAVFLGFLAENQREHYIEKKRAREYARLLADDLNFDIAELNRAEKVLNKIITAGDSLGKLLSVDDVKKISGGKLYYYEYWSGWRWSIISRDATLQQLKSSGALRYLHNTTLVRKILSYEESVRVIYMLQNKYEPEKTDNWNLVQKVFYQEYFNILDSDPALTRDSTAKNFDASNVQLNSFINTNYPLHTYDKNVLFELKNWAYNSSRNYRVIVNDIKSMRSKAHEVIESLKKEYHFD